MLHDHAFICPFLGFFPVFFVIAFLLLRDLLRPRDHATRGKQGAEPGPDLPSSKILEYAGRQPFWFPWPRRRTIWRCVSIAVIYVLLSGIFVFVYLKLEYRERTWTVTFVDDATGGPVPLTAQEFRAYYDGHRPIGQVHAEIIQPGVVRVRGNPPSRIMVVVQGYTPLIMYDEIRLSDDEASKLVRLKPLLPPR